MENTAELNRQREYIEKLKGTVVRLTDELGRIPKCAVITFGCQMNARDSEKLSGILREAGFALDGDEKDADLIIYNTCSVRDNANQRVYGHLGSLKPVKKKNPGLKIALCGCMMQEPSVIENISKNYKFIDLVFGTHNIFKFAELLYRMYEEDSGQIIDIWESTNDYVEDLPVDRKYSYKSGVNIMYGCNNFCTYCIVPYVRGRERSRDAKEIIREIERLSDDGVIEVMLLGQNVNSYGKGLDDDIDFSDLLREVEKIDKIKRIRFMTSHPKDLSDKLIDTIADSIKICRHIHLPLQSGSDRILKAMNRHYTKESYLDLVGRIKNAVPDIAVTTDIIIGFPGERAEDVDDTIDVINRVEYDNAFTFIYSKRTGTPAAAMEDQVSEEFAKEQFDRVLDAVRRCAGKRNGMLVGRTEEALVESLSDNDPSMVTGRLSNNSMVHFKGDKELIGTIVPVKLHTAGGFYYIGDMVRN